MWIRGRIIKIPIIFRFICLVFGYMVALPVQLLFPRLEINNIVIGAVVCGDVPTML